MKLLVDVFTTAADALTDRIKGAPTSRTLNERFKAAVFAGHIRRVRKALEGGAKPDVGLGWDARHEHLNTFALMRATMERDREMIDLLLAFGADIDKPLTGFEKTTPLAAAALAGDTRMVEFLLSRGADAEKAQMRPMGWLLVQLEQKGLTDVHTLIKTALDAKQAEQAALQKSAAPSSGVQVDDEGDADPLIAPKTATFRKTKVAVTP